MRDHGFVMEPMRITILSIQEHGGQVVTHARAEADAATIHLRVHFAKPCGITWDDMWDRARDEVLKYLDVS